MSLECGMEHINDMWDWAPKRDRFSTSKKNGAEIMIDTSDQLIQPEVNPAVTPEIIQKRIMEDATWLMQNKDSLPAHITPKQAQATIDLGLKFLMQKDILARQNVIHGAEVAATKEPVITDPQPSLPSGKRTGAIAALLAATL